MRNQGPEKGGEYLFSKTHSVRLLCYLSGCPCALLSSNDGERSKTFVWWDSSGHYGLLCKLRFLLAHVAKAGLEFWSFCLYPLPPSAWIKCAPSHLALLGFFCGRLIFCDIKHSGLIFEFFKIIVTNVGMNISYMVFGGHVDQFPLASIRKLWLFEQLFASLFSKIAPPANISTSIPVFPKVQSFCLALLCSETRVLLCSTDRLSWDIRYIAQAGLDLMVNLLPQPPEY